MSHININAQLGQLSSTHIPSIWGVSDLLIFELDVSDKEYSSGNYSFSMELLTTDFFGSSSRVSFEASLVDDCIFEITFSDFWEHIPFIANQNHLSLSIEYKGGRTMSKVRLHCVDVQLNLDSSTPYIIRTLKSSISFVPVSSVHEYQHIETPILPNYPYIAHQIYWAPTIVHSDGIRSPSAIAVDFVFSKVSGVDDSLEYIITHPLLDITTISSVHPSSQGNSNDEGSRAMYMPNDALYNLIPTSRGFITQCNSDSSMIPGSDSDSSLVDLPSSSFEFTPQNQLMLKLPQETLGINYVCSFTIYYSPDVIANVFSSSQSRSISVSTPSEYPGSSPNTFPGSAFTLPSTIPSLQPHAIPLEDGIQPQRVYTWVSPHHYRSTSEFEFGISIAAKYKVKAGFAPYMYDNDPRVQIKMILSRSGNDETEIDTSGSKITCYSLLPPYQVILSLTGNQIRFHMIASYLYDEQVFGLTCRVVIPNQDDKEGTPDPIYHLAPRNSYLELVYDDNTSASDGNGFTIIDSLFRPVSTLDKILLSPYPPKPLGFIHQFDDEDEDGEEENGDDSSHESIIFPTITPLTFTPHLIQSDDQVGDNNVVGIFAQGAMHLQYLPSLSYIPPLSPSSSYGDSCMYLHLVFPEFLHSSWLYPEQNGEDNGSKFTDITASIHITTSDGKFSLYNHDSISATVFDVEWQSVSGSFQMNDIMQNTFTPNGLIRSPTLIIPFYGHLDTTKPLRITVRFRLGGIEDISSLSPLVVYPLLLPQSLSSMNVYSPEYAVITPIRPTVLTGYSYRCVTWDKLVAPYILNQMDEITTLDGSNSMPCPSYKEGLSSLWRKRQGTSDNDICMFELAAVCVTPSTTVEDEFIVHPLADCPSFLGAVHAVPCNLMESSEPQKWGYRVDTLDAEISEPELDKDDIHKKRSLTLWWSYRGDPRLLLTVAIKPFLETDGIDNDDANTDGYETKGWITLARDIPAYLSPERDQSGVTIGFPTLDSQVTTVVIRLSINGAPNTPAMVTRQHTIKKDQWDGYQAGCEGNDNKVFDDVTHLCRCRDGFIPKNPIGVDNPLVHPLDFECEKKPSEQVPIDPEQCHAIPKGVTPPYRTQQCGYGFAVNTNGKCDECTCFNSWTKGTNDDDTINDAHIKCERCHLKDVCHPTHTAEITFTPEYCLVRRCLCEPGYSGDTCQYAVMYGTLAYHDVATDEQKASLVDATKDHPVIVPRRLITAFQPRVTNNVKASLGDTPVEAFVQQATQVLSDDGQNVITSIMVALGRLTNADVSPSPSPSPFIMAAPPFTPTADDNNTTSNDLGDLHYAWEQLQNNYQDRPVYKDDDYGTLNGGVGSAYDPHCVPNAYTYCPDGKEDDLLPPESQVDPDELDEVYKEEEDPDNPIIDISDDEDDDNSKSSSNTTTYIIIGVVVGVVLLLFVLLIVAIVYCRKHDKMCFRKRRGKGGATGDSRSVELANSNNNSKSNTNTPASAPPPSSTMSTSSYLPTQVQVDDPTLPADWIALEDKSTGKIYYSNKVTMESSWDHPAKPKAEKSAYGW